VEPYRFLSEIQRTVKNIVACSSCQWTLILMSKISSSLQSPMYSGNSGDKGRIGLYTKLCDFTLLFMILQVELRLNKDH